MKKKKAILLGVAILLCTLFVNLVIYEQSGETDLTFNNLEALAQGESSGGANNNCVASGYVCFGVDKNGSIGRHPGLRLAQ